MNRTFSQSAKSQIKLPFKNIDGERKVVGTIPWLAPEILQTDPHSEKSDIYSLAVVFWEIFSEAHPYFEELTGKKFTSSSLIEAIISNDYRPIISWPSIATQNREVHECFEGLIVACWDRNPTERPLWSIIMAELEFCREQCKLLRRLSSQMSNSAISVQTKPKNSVREEAVVLPNVPVESDGIMSKSSTRNKLISFYDMKPGTGTNVFSYDTFLKSNSFNNS